RLCARLRRYQRLFARLQALDGHVPARLHQALLLSVSARARARHRTPSNYIRHVDYDNAHEHRFPTNEPFMMRSPPYQGGGRGGFETARQQPPPCPLLGKGGGHLPNQPVAHWFRSQHDLRITGKALYPSALAATLCNPIPSVYPVKPCRDMTDRAMPVAARA